MRKLNMLLSVALLMAFGSAAATTVEELYELKKRQYEEQLRSGKDGAVKHEPSKGPDILKTSAPVGAPPAVGTAEMRLISLMGVGKEIEATINYKGSTVPLKKGMDIDGWTLSDIGDNWVDMTKVSKTKSGKTVKGKTVRLRIMTIVRSYGDAPTAGNQTAPNRAYGNYPPLPFPVNSGATR